MKILYDSDKVAARITEIAKEILDTYPDKKPLFVCLLKGAVPFSSQLMSAITRLDATFYPEIEYLHISAYGDEREATHATQYSSISDDIIRGRDILVLDDCLDRGLTYNAARKHLTHQGAVSVELIVLANKMSTTPDRATPLISGFETPDVWLVGMGMDDAATSPEAQRWADYIGHVSPE